MQGAPQRRIQAAALAALGLLVFGWMPARAADPMKISVTGIVSGFAPYFIAIDRGYFAEQSIDAEIIQAGGNTATPALLSGDLQFSTSASIAMTAILRGGKLKIVFVSNDHVPYQLWTTDPSVKTIADLKGKQVGVETRGDTHELAVRTALKATGVDPSTVIFSPMANRSAIVAGVLSGALGSGSMILDEVERLKTMPNARMLFNLESVALIAGGGVFSDEFLAQHRDLAKRFMRAVIEGSRRADAFPDDVVASILKRNPAQTRQQILDAIAAGKPLATADGTIPVAVQNQEIANRSDFLGIPADQRPAASTMFDFSLLHEVNAELDAQGWKP